MISVVMMVLAECSVGIQTVSDKFSLETGQGRHHIQVILQLTLKDRQDFANVGRGEEEFSGQRTTCRDRGTWKNSVCSSESVGAPKQF